VTSKWDLFRKGSPFEDAGTWGFPTSKSKFRGGKKGQFEDLTSRGKVRAAGGENISAEGNAIQRHRGERDLT